MDCQVNTSLTQCRPPGSYGTADKPVPFLNTYNSVSGIVNSVKPQFRQTKIFGKTHTMGLSDP